MRGILAVILLAGTIGSTALSAAPTSPGSPAIAQAVGDASRPKADRDADALRKPAETLAFSGVKPGMVVGEFYPGGGYFTRMISDIVGPKGHVYGSENVAWKGPPTTELPKQLPNVSIEALPFGTVRFPVPLDVAWVTQNYHDLKIAEYGKVDIAAFNRAVFAALKPGGVFFVLDHEGPAGIDDAAIAKLHRVERAQVIREVTAAGFKLEAEGNFLRQVGDDHSLSIFDKKIRGHTDQYALKFVRPRR
ncbi:MAG: methyltransferase [Sphingomonadales bacterium]